MNLFLPAHKTLYGYALDYSTKKPLLYRLNGLVISQLMYTANYLGQSISISCATLRKVRNIPKDRAKKILFSRGIKNSSLQNLHQIFIKTMTHQKTTRFKELFNINDTKIPRIRVDLYIKIFKSSMI